MDNDMRYFIDSNYSYYMNKYEDMRMSGKKASWNWSAFIFSGYWALYRKMYVAGFLMMAINYVISFIPVFGDLLSLVFWILVGAYGNRLYLEYVENNLANIRSLDSYEKEKAFKRKGGTNIIVPIVVLILLGIFLPV